MPKFGGLVHITAAPGGMTSASRRIGRNGFPLVSILIVIHRGLEAILATYRKSAHLNAADILLVHDDHLVLQVVAASYAGDWVTKSIRRRGEPAFPSMPFGI